MRTNRIIVVALFLMCCLFGCQISPDNTFSSGVNRSDDIRTDGDYSYEMLDDGVKLLHHYNVDAEHLSVPETIQGKPVRGLASNVFYQHKLLQSVELPDTLISIEGGAFYRCYSLQEIYIPAGVTKIDSNPFFRSSSLKKIEVSPENPAFVAVDGVLYNKDKTVLVAYPEGKSETKFTVPATVTKLFMDCFGYDTKLEELTILSNVTEFPEWEMFVFPEQIRCLVEPGSAAERYVKAHDVPYSYINTGEGYDVFSMRIQEAIKNGEAKVMEWDRNVN